MCSIDGLEREREEIMNIIEVQINSAIDFDLGEDSPASTCSLLPGEEDDANTTTGTAAGGHGQMAGIDKKARYTGRNRIRPGTSDSAASFATANTNASGPPVSVFGAIRKGAAAAGGGAGGNKGNAAKRVSVQTNGTIERAEVAIRVATIQAKVSGAEIDSIGTTLEGGKYIRRTKLTVNSLISLFAPLEAKIWLLSR